MTAFVAKAKWMTVGVALLISSFSAVAAPSKAPLKIIGAHEYLYVASLRGEGVEVIALPEHEIVGRISQKIVGGRPDDLVFSPDGRTLYISRLDFGDVIALDTKTEKQLWSVTFGDNRPNHLSLSGDGRYLYVPFYTTKYTAVVDTVEQRQVAMLDTGYGSHGSMASPDGKRVYIGTTFTPQLTEIDTATNKILRYIHMPAGVRPFAIEPTGKKLYAQLTALHGFVVVDLPSGKVERTVSMPVPAGQTVPEATYQPDDYSTNHGLNISPDGKYLVANGTLNNFTTIWSLPDLNLLATIPLGLSPNWVMFSADSRFAYVTSKGDGMVSVISMAERKEVKRIKVGERSSRMRTGIVPERPASIAAH